jgi:preprotein translocase subunit SecE
MKTMALMTGASGDLMKALTTAHPYKPNQGRYARWGTLVVIVVGVIWAARSATTLFSLETSPLVRYGVPGALGILAVWAGYRLVHWPRFADFLITTESEMAKVTWPGKREVKLSTIVVLMLTILLAAFLWVVDRLWQLLLYAIGILEFMSRMFGDG